jgi:hypothetical protein
LDYIARVADKCKNIIFVVTRKDLVPDLSAVFSKDIQRLSEHCRAVFKITEDKNPRYLWMPTRMGIFKSGDHGSGIHKLPVYRPDYIK